MTSESIHFYRKSEEMYILGKKEIIFLNDSKTEQYVNEVAREKSFNISHGKEKCFTSYRNLCVD